jgi:hypothetical protein
MDAWHGMAVEFRLETARCSLLVREKERMWESERDMITTHVDISHFT